MSSRHDVILIVVISFKTEIIGILFSQKYGPNNER